MILSAEERAAKKQSQMARLAAKGTPGYARVYAQQPDQIRLAAEAKAKRQADQDAKDALKRAVIAAGDEAASLWSTSNDLRAE